MNHVSGLVAAALFFFACVPARAELAGFTAGKWKTSFGIEERARAEQRQNFDLNESIQDNGALVFQRFKLNGRAVSGDKYELFAEGIDLRVYSAHIRKTYQTDAFDLYQGYLRVNRVAGLPVDLKVGRQELKYGKGRLLWNSLWANRSNHYDGVVAHYAADGFYGDVFHAQRVNYFNHSFDEGSTHDVLDGAYLGWQKGKTSPLIEAYFLANADTCDIRKLRRYTTGVRALTVIPGGLALDVEMPYQFGMTAGSDISAYAFHADAGRGFASAWKPEVNLAYDFASGDHTPGNKSHTFVPLFQATHEPYGIMDFFRWENMHALDLTVTLSPVPRLKLIPATGFFWLASAHDYWYDAAGQKLRIKRAGRADSYVGQETSLAVKYDAGCGFGLNAAYAHFFSGQYAADTGAHDDADWVYLEATLKL